MGIGGGRDSRSEPSNAAPGVARRATASEGVSGPETASRGAYVYLTAAEIDVLEQGIETLGAGLGVYREIWAGFGDLKRKLDLAAERVGEES